MHAPAAERFVLIRPGALGDALLTFPVLALLRHARPAAHITLVARGDVLPLAVASGLADAGWPYDVPMWGALFVGEPPTSGPARDILASSTVVAWLGDDADGMLVRNLAALGAERAAIAPGKPGPDARRHMALTLAGALSPLAIAVPETPDALAALLPPLTPPQEDEREAAAIWRALWLTMDARRMVALHPGSGGAAKRWPPANFAALAGALAAVGSRPLLIEGPQDAAIVAEVRAQFEIQGGGTASAIAGARGLDVGALAALLARCAAYIGNDAGVSHLAGLLGVPTVVLFGPTEPAVWAPLGSHVHVVRATTQALGDITVAEVMAALSELTPM
ncbi:MAG: hypothetical protein OJF49_002327 [Ktedonobacterales bacterium]|jgi:ADP-heptose:LPS heptosyltransferase|nr:MAG: hypothetical protein OJF49_002327 [Ktedonobacterales bacterium]